MTKLIFIICIFLSSCCSHQVSWNRERIQTEMLIQQEQRLNDLSYDLQNKKGLTKQEFKELLEEMRYLWGLKHNREKLEQR